MDKLLEIYETSLVNDSSYAEQNEKIIYGKSDNLLKFVSCDGKEEIINFKPTIGSGYIDLGVAKIEYGMVTVTTNSNGTVSSTFLFPLAFTSDVKTFVISQFSGSGVAKVKGGNTSLSGFSVSLEEGASETNYVLKWLAIGV